MFEHYVGELMLCAGSQIPAGWMPCDGQILPIVHFQSLFSVIGTAFGGDGRNTFALPDLRGRVPMHAGSGPKLQPRTFGAQVGRPSVSLTERHLPPHRHAVHQTLPITPGDPSGDLAVDAHAVSRSDQRPAEQPVVPAGGSAPVDLTPPAVVMTWCIAFQGVFPTEP